MIKLVASDMDGTLLPDFDSYITEEMFDIIRELKKHGITFLAASGRQHPNLEHLFTPVKDDIYYMCENGCLLYVDGKMVRKEVMDYGLGQELLHAIMEKPGAEALVSGEETCYIQPKDPEYLVQIRDVVRNEVTVVDDIFNTPEEYFKISVYEKNDAGQAAEYWQRLFGDEATVVTSGLTWIDMMPKNVNKGTSISWLMHYLGITPKEVMAFGDNYNDEEMLNLVEYSYAMNKAPKDIRDFCYGTTGSVEKTLRKFLADLR